MTAEQGAESIVVQCEPQNCDGADNCAAAADADVETLPLLRERRFFRRGGPYCSNSQPDAVQLTHRITLSREGESPDLAFPTLVAAGVLLEKKCAGASEPSADESPSFKRYR